MQLLTEPAFYVKVN